MSAPDRPDRPVNMRDVARLSGVSVGTVSNVVNTPDVVAAATRDRVVAAIRELGWVRNEPARQLRAGRSRSLAMVVMTVSNPFFTDVMTGVEEHAFAHGYVLHFASSANQASREDTQLELFEQMRVRGILLAPVGDRPDRLTHLRRAGIPVVLVDWAGEDDDVCSVAVDDVQGGRLAAAHLIEQGRHRLTFVGGPVTVPQVADRLSGARQAVAAHRLGTDALEVLPTGALDVANGLTAAAQLAERPAHRRPTGVFAANDLLAIGLLQGFVTRGLQVPRDIAIVGYDDIEFAAAAAVPLSSVRQPRHRMGVAAAEALLREITETEAGGPHRHRRIRFEPELVVRRSTRPDPPA